MDLSDDSSDESVPVDALESFREKWQKELVITTSEKVQKSTNKSAINENGDSADDKEAKSLFLQATELEKCGKVFEAMRLYRRAMQLDPDIEHKIYEESKNIVLNNNNPIVNGPHRVEDIMNNDENADDESEEDLSGMDMLARFELALQNGNGRLFQRGNAEAGVIVTGGVHISDLPTEIILHILRYVVASHIDVRSLEQCSMASRGFYICARDSEIWKAACLKVWGHHGIAAVTKYSSWRQMFIERPRVCFHGCYISKTSYVRYGERSFQDQFYRPVHLIEYFRYMRFFPDGTVLMITTTDEPAQVVGKLANTNRNDILRGHYRYSDNIIIVELRKNQETQNNQRRIRNYSEFDRNGRSFYLQLEIGFTKKRRTPQLMWNQYSIIQQQNKYEETSTDFEITAAKYPPLIFSRVKSYVSTANQPI